ncbi:hypothetical protein QBC36DRAFT_328738 [Triangularia setosa]|uniref:Uncharacterized protein n=1 Tax=Triangularia setosa TaxID=2587417 RepID=A0AAN6W7Y2_9PEZI|nr:hypothetical protein QBC36DRAFT_328738 [Podospora setosa]
MAAQYIPGAFPASIPPTPADEPVQQPQQYHEEQDQGYQHRERNELHKPNELRGHAHTDSGVNFTESEPIQPAKRNDNHWVGPSEAVGGGTYVRDDIGSYQPSQSVQQPSQTRELARGNSDEEFPIRRNKVDEQPLGATAVGVGAGAATHGQDTAGNTDTTPRQSHEQRFDPPYWGDLPKASSGGIYNTVTGHGSAKDDHDQHHHLPQRGSGVYNSVSGHGSQDAESMRHRQPTTAEDRKATTGGSTGALLAAPLAKIPEGQQKQAFTSPASETNRLNFPPSSLPESIARDNSLLAAPGSGPADREVDMSRQPVSSSPTQRAFPLSSSPKDVHNDEATSTSNHRNSALAGTAALGAGAMAYGIADNNKRDKEVSQTAPSGTQVRHSRSTSEDQGARATGGLLSRKSRDDRRNSSVDKHRSRSRSVHGEKKPKVFGIFNRHKDEEALREDTSTYEPPAQQAEHKQEPMLVGSTTGTTKTRNRLRKGSRSEPKDRRVSSELPTEANDPSHNKTKAVAGAATGAGAFGLLHHNKGKDSKTTEDQATATQATQQQSPSFSSHPNQSLASQAPVGSTTQVKQSRGSGAGAAVGLDALELAHRHDPAHPVPGKATPAGLATHKHDDPSTPFEHPREPPSPPRNDVGGSQSWVPPAVIGAAASGAPLAMRQSRDLSAANPTINQHPDTNVVYNTLPSGTGSGAQSNSASISPRGSAAHESINTKRPVANAPGDFNVFVSSGQPLGSSRPSESNNTQRGSTTQEPAHNHIASNTPSGVALGSARQSESHGSRGGVVTQEPGSYNHLTSGTTSGVKQQHSTDQSATSRHPDAGQVTQEPGNYNHLGSGTASGVATVGIAAAGVAAHKSAHGSETAASRQGTVTREAGQYSNLPLGNDSGVKRDSGPAEGSRAHNLAAAGSSRPFQNRTDSGPYNKLPSGTPSGVKIKPRDNSHRATEPAVQGHDQHSSDRNASLPTGPTGAVFTQHHQSQPSNIDTRANELKDLPLPASSSSPTNAHPSSHHTVVSPPVHAAPETGKATNPPPAAGQLVTPQFTQYPNPELVQNMSPEVMPESYRESITKPHEQGMSPEVMPDSYRESVSRPSHQGVMSPEVMPNAYRSSVPRESNHKTRATQATQSNGEQQMSPEVMPREYREAVGHGDKFVNPALAAATGAWASTGNSVGGISGGNVQQGRVLHRCENCGQHNDISGYVKEAVAKVTRGERL